MVALDIVLVWVENETMLVGAVWQDPQIVSVYSHVQVPLLCTQVHNKIICDSACTFTCFQYAIHFELKMSWLNGESEGKSMESISRKWLLKYCQLLAPSLQFHWPVARFSVKLWKELGVSELVVDLFQWRYLVVRANQRFVEMSRIETYMEATVSLGDVCKCADPLGWLFDATYRMPFNHLVKFCFDVILQRHWCSDWWVDAAW